MIYFLFVASVLSVVSPDLLSVVVIHRHGDRNPLRSYKTDPYMDESHWPNGLGQLTKVGIRRQYELGLWLRSRYPSLSSSYSPKTLRALSTDVDRTLMSAQLTLAGLYPPNESSKFDEKINWQPIPIHTRRPDEDPVLAMKKQCRKYQKLFNNLLNSSHINEINEINRNLYEFLSNKTGETIQSVYDVEIIYNVLLTQSLRNKTLPDWAVEVFPDKMKPATILRYKIPCYNEEMARLKTGLLFGEIYKSFKKSLNGTKPKLVLYSGHDSTLADVMTTMGNFNDEIPPYSSAILLELHQNLGKFYINIFFKNDTGVHNLTLNSCSFDCSFDNFTKILQPVVIFDEKIWEQECEN